MNDISDVEAAYLAGLIDGEGCIYISKYYSKNGGRIRHSLSLIISNSSLELLENIQTVCGAGSIHQFRKSNKKWRSCYSLCFTGMTASGILLRIVPYMILKKPQALIAINYATTMLEGRKRISDASKEYRNYCAEEVSNYNKHVYEFVKADGFLSLLDFTNDYMRRTR
jgi:hypothetical protein